MLYSVYSSKNRTFLHVFFQSESLEATIMRGNLLYYTVHSNAKTLLVQKTHYNKISILSDISRLCDAY